MSWSYFVVYKTDDESDDDGDKKSYHNIPHVGQSIQVEVPGVVSEKGIILNGNIIKHQYNSHLTAGDVLFLNANKFESQPSVLTGRYGGGGFGPPKPIHKETARPTAKPLIAP